MSWYGWKSYVPVAVRRASALDKMEKLQKKGLDIQPVEIKGRKITQTFWGKAWVDHLESFSDYKNRLPRGRTYVRNGSLCHLDISKGEANALVAGSKLYKVKIIIKTLPKKKWIAVKKQCAGQIGSLLELLQGSLSKEVMTVVTDRKNGLFPLSKEIHLKCDCPDYAVMCKHLAAALYGIGTRLDEKPKLLFLLRGVDHDELISAETGRAVAAKAGKKRGGKRLAEDSLTEVFGIEISEETARTRKKSPRRRKSTPSKSKKGSKAKDKRTIKNEAKPTFLKIHVVTGKTVAKERKKFAMSKNQFARLLGISASTISNWEKKPGNLSLQPHTQIAWNMSKKLTKQQAWRKLKKL